MLEKEADRAAVTAWARKCLKNRDFVILDTETTGLSNSEIVEIAIISAQGLPLLNAILKPQGAIPKEASAIHHITDNHVQQALTFEDIYPLLVKLLTGKTIIIYNAMFDTAMLACEYDRHQLALIDYGHVECAMKQYSAFVGDWNQFYGNYRWQRLPTGDHSAIGDCQATLKIIEKMACE